MRFDDARVLDSICYDLLLGEYPRALNREKINELANGHPPYTATEVEENGIAVNVNDLSHTRLMHDGRTQFFNGFMKSGNLVNFRTDMGPVHRRSKHTAIVTREFNRPLRKSIAYFERQRAKFGELVLHGIAPGLWRDQDRWCSKPIAIGDMLVPGNTELGFENLPFFVVRRSFTAMELQKTIARSRKGDGWNERLVKDCLKWLDSQVTTLRNVNWSEMWKPEEVEERIKGDGGYYMGDQVPTIQTFDVYGYVDDGKESGWVRRIILDAWGEPSSTGGQVSIPRKTDKLYDFNKPDFLFTSRKRRIADSWQNIAAFQFADLSAVFPAQYHCVRSLGWLMFASCHLGTRMRCKFYESVFEALMQLFQVEDMTEAQRALKLDLVNRGFVDKSLKPIPAQDRWQVNAQLVELGLRDNQQVTSENSSAFTQPQNFSQNKTEKTKFQVMAELNTTTSLVSAALAQAYQYEVFEDREMFRRFCKKVSLDPDVRTFRENCLKQGVPEKMLVPEAWDLEHERVMGGGNKTMEMAIANWLMEQRDKFDPEPQREILRDAVVAVTDDAARAEELVPEKPVRVTDSVHDAQLAAGTLMQGLPMAIKTGINHIEYVETLLGTLAAEVDKTERSGGMTSPEHLAGMQSIAKHIQDHIAIIAQDPVEKPRVKRYMDELGKIINMLRAYQQRLEQAAQEAAKQGQNGNGGMDPKDMAKIQGIQMNAKVKAENASQSHAQRTAQRQIQFEQEMRQRAQEDALELKKKQLELKAELAAKDLEAAANIRRERVKALSEPDDKPRGRS